MSNNYFIPKSVFKGRDSNGNLYQFEEWDPGVLASMEVPGYIFTFICAFAFLSITGPLILLYLLLWHGVNTRFSYVVPGVLSAYVLFDFYNGWLSMIATTFFADDKWMFYIMTANVITLLVSIVFVLFGSYLLPYVYQDVSVYTEEEYNKLPNADKNRLSNKVEKRYNMVLYMVFVLIFTGVVVGTTIDNKHKGWVANNMKNHE
jgi:hypothetical protein